jgi:phosphatidylglycerophosphate synthase
MLKRIPNALTSLRIAAVPVLLWLALARRHDAFTAVLLFCLVGDIADGILARALRATSSLGALLDSIADTLLFFVAILGTWIFYPDALRAHPVAFSLVPGLWAAEVAAALLRYGRLSSFHTYLSRIAAYAMGAFIGLLFLAALHPWLLHLAVGVLTLATAEEFALLWLLPQWTPDVRGVWWVLRQRRGGWRSTGSP